MKFGTQTVARRLVVVLLVMFALTEGIWSVAQTQATSRTPASSRAVLLKEGTEVKLKLRDKITSKTAVEGDLREFDSRSGSESRGDHGGESRICRGWNRLSRREGRNAG